MMQEILPNEQEPEYGEVSLGLNGGPSVPLTEAVRWVDDGVCVVRSLEFDVTGEGQNWPVALEAMLEHTRDYWGFLAELVAEGKATEREQRIEAMLGSRLVEAYETALKAVEGQARKRLTVNLRRKPPRQRQSQWSPRPRPNTLQPLGV
jgi:hypothetical protein